MLRSTSYQRTVHRIKCWPPRGTSQRNHQGPGRDIRCVSKRSVRTYPAERLLLWPSDLPERQPAVLCSSQRDRDGWRQRVPIPSERKGEFAAKSFSYAHNRRMSHPQTHLQRVGGLDNEDNDRVRHPRTGNDRNQEDTDGTASWKRRDRKHSSTQLEFWRGIDMFKLHFMKLREYLFVHKKNLIRGWVIYDRIKKNSVN